MPGLEALGTYEYGVRKHLRGSVPHRSAARHSAVYRGGRSHGAVRPLPAAALAPSAGAGPVAKTLSSSRRETASRGGGVRYLSKVQIWPLRTSKSRNFAISSSLERRSLCSCTAAAVVPPATVAAASMNRVIHAAIRPQVWRRRALEAADRRAVGWSGAAVSRCHRSSSARRVLASPSRRAARRQLPATDCAAAWPYTCSSCRAGRAAAPSSALAVPSRMSCHRGPRGF